MNLRRLDSSCGTINTRSHVWDEFIHLRKAGEGLGGGGASIIERQDFDKRWSRVDLVRRVRRAIGSVFIHADAQRAAGRKASCLNTCEQ